MVVVMRILKTTETETPHTERLEYVGEEGGQ